MVGSPAKMALISTGEPEPPAVRAEEERPYAEAVADQRQGPRAHVPEGDGKLAIEPCEGRLTPCLPAVDDDLGVARRAESVALDLQLGAELDVVVDLAIEDDPQRAVLVAQWLLARGQVDDREPALARPTSRSR